MRTVTYAHYLTKKHACIVNLSVYVCLSGKEEVLPLPTPTLFSAGSSGKTQKQVFLASLFKTEDYLITVTCKEISPPNITTSHPKKRK